MPAPQAPNTPADAPTDAPANAPAAGPPRALTDFAPVPRRYRRSHGWSPAAQRAFIEYLADTGSVEQACRMVGLSATSVYRLRRHPEADGFVAAWEAARAFAVARIEDFAIDRAINGVEVPVFAYGDRIASRRVHNEQLVMFMLRNLAPERYCEGGARGMSALDRRTLARLKREWRAEWEEEREARSVSPADIARSIEKKIDAFKARVLARSSPRAYALEIEKAAQVRADEAAGWRPGRPYAPFEAKAAELLPALIEEVRAEWPAYEEAHPPFDEDEEDGDGDEGEDGVEAGEDPAAPQPPVLPAPDGGDAWR